MFFITLAYGFVKLLKRSDLVFTNMICLHTDKNPNYWWIHILWFGWLKSVNISCFKTLLSAVHYKTWEWDGEIAIVNDIVVGTKYLYWVEEMNHMYFKLYRIDKKTYSNMQSYIWLFWYLSYFSFYISYHTARLVSKPFIHKQLKESLK